VCGLNVIYTEIILQSVCTVRNNGKRELYNFAIKIRNFSYSYLQTLRLSAFNF